MDNHDSLNNIDPRFINIINTWHKQLKEDVKKLDDERLVLEAWKVANGLDRPRT